MNVVFSIDIYLNALASSQSDILHFKWQVIISQTIFIDVPYVSQKSDLWLLHLVCQTHHIFALDFNWNFMVTGTLTTVYAKLFCLLFLMEYTACILFLHEYLIG